MEDGHWEDPQPIDLGGDLWLTTETYVSAEMAEQDALRWDAEHQIEIVRGRMIHCPVYLGPVFFPDDS
jgi:hypothetical protein